MPKTGTQIKTWAESLTEQITLDATSVILWINEFLTQELGSDAMVVDTQDYPNTDYNTWNALPDDFSVAFKVESFGSSGMAAAEFLGQLYDYEVFDTNIKLNANGNYRLHYTTVPAEIVAIGASIVVDDCFNKAGALWVAYRGLTNDDEDNAKSGSLGMLRLQEYMTEKPVAIKARKTRFHKRGRIRNVQW